MGMKDIVKLTDQPIQIEKEIREVFNPSSGGIDVFIGTVRDQTRGRRVIRLEFEAYAPMAIKEMEKIIARARDQWPVTHMSMVHRVGVLHLEDIAVLIAVACPHRAEAFAACQFAIDTLKETVPIWKKEVFEGGETWVAAHP